MALKESPTFYLASVVFQVEDTLFRVPRLYFERESEVFRAMFQLPVAADTVPDGSSNEHPLKLEGVDKGDFEQLLRVMFPERALGTVLSIPQWSSALKLTALWQMNELTQAILAWISMSRLSFEDWVALLDFSFQYQLPETRATAIRELSPMFQERVIDLVVLGQKYNVKHWLRHGLRLLVQQPAPLSDDEGEALGLKTVLKLYRVRNAFTVRLSGNLRWLDENDKRAGAVEEIEKEFDELSSMSSEPDHGQTST